MLALDYTDDMHKETLSIILPQGLSLSSKEKGLISANYGVEIIDTNTLFPINNSLGCLELDNYYVKAIVNSGGDWLCFVNYREEIQPVIDACQRNMMRSGLAIVGLGEANWLQRCLGLRKIHHTLPPMFQKSYLATNLDVFTPSKLFDFQVSLLRHADKVSKLCLDPDYFRKYEKPTFNKMYLLRPTFTIINRILKKRLSNYVIDNESLVKIRNINRRKVQFSNNIPIFINCRDRLGPLKKLVEWLEREGMNNIIFIDNHSSYKPLLKYYEKTPYKVYRLPVNIGHQAPWSSGLVALLANNKPYIVTDPDIIPPIDQHRIVKIIFNLINKYSKVNKVGFALRIDNLPDSYKPKIKVIKWEEQFWKEKIEKDVYIADIDTTFALYRPNTPYVIRPALRVAGNYTAEHEPWYQDSNNPTEEYAYYLKHARSEIASWGIDESTSSSVYDS